MLQKLHIKNFAIISKVELNFTEGLIALTGETGAGKSIILGAINLILGARADTNALYNKEEKCIVEATFDVSKNKNVQDFLLENDIENNIELIIRREITSNGRSRAFINDTPVLLNILQQIGEMIIDLHRQFDTLEVKEQDFQLQFLDILANNFELIEIYKKQYQTWHTAKQNLVQLKSEQQQIHQEYDYNKFMFDELDKMNFSTNEIENAEEELAILSNAEELKASLQQVNFSLQNSETPIVVELKNIIVSLNKFSNQIKKLHPVLDRLSSSLIELKDIANELETLENEMEFDQEKLNLILDRFNEGTRLLKKHHLNSTQELLELQKQLAKKLLIANNLDSIIENATNDVNLAYENLLHIANKLSAKRLSTSTSAQKLVNELLPKVGMPNAKIKIDIQQIACNHSGIDAVQFLFDANQSKKYLPIAKAASGGELGRLMLCIKSLLAKANQLGTIIFDEIDTGISGEVAKQVASILKSLSEHHQIITVTHSPQIASKAKYHLFVYKSADEDAVIRTKVKVLSAQERIEHIAEMLSGSSPSSTALKAAKELIET